MDDLVAALHLLAQKLRVNVNELSDRYVLYTQITAVVFFLIDIVIAYVAYRVINYCYKQYQESDPMRILDAKVKAIKDEVRRDIAKESNKILRNSINSVANVIRAVLAVLIVGSFLIAAACNIPAMAMPQGKALDKILDSLKETTKVEIVQPKQTRSTRPTQENAEHGEEDGSGGP